jgi:betaine reductase
MDSENQANIKKIAENENDAKGNNNIIVVLGAGDIEGALISAETVTVGDPSFTGPLAGVSLRLPVYHILEPLMEEVVPQDIYEEHVGVMAMTADRDKIGREFQAIRDKMKNG